MKEYELKPGEASIRTQIKCGRLLGIPGLLAEVAFACNLELNVQMHVKHFITESIGFEVHGPEEGVERFRLWLRSIESVKD